MATVGDGRAPSESGGAGEKFRKRLFQREKNEDPQNVSQEVGRNNLTGASEQSTHEGGDFDSVAVTIGKSQLEQILKQMTFTRSETEHLIALLHSRTIEEESSTPLIRLEASTTSGSRKRHKHGGETANLHSSAVSSRVLEEETASPAELTNACKGSTIATQDLKLIHNKATVDPKTSQDPTTMENLPDELLSNIFIRLLSKQLAQMRSVSKSWNTLLSHTSFIKSHLHHSINHNDQIFLVLCDDKESQIFTTHLLQSDSPQLERTDFIKLPVNPPFKYTKGFTIIGCVNGLLCFFNHDFEIQIWNPSLSAVSTLPPSSVPSRGYSSIITIWRFGFDPKTYDCKVVKLTGLTRKPEPAIDIEWWLQVEIYSLRRGSWELVTERIPSHITRINDDDGVCVDGYDGYLHWWCCTNGKDSWDRILAFDLGSETFREMPLPGFIPDPNREKVLGVLEGKLCVMSWVEDEPCEVWVMEEYGVADSWVKRHVFSNFTKDTCLYGFISYNELIFYEDGSLSLYDPIANKEKYFEDYVHEFCRPQKVVKYVDSLIWK